VIGAERVGFEDLVTPFALLNALPWVLAFAWLARRLLGIGPGRWWITAAAGSIGWFGAGLVVVLAQRRTSNTATLSLVALACAVGFTMIAVVALDLVSRRRLSATPGGIPHPIRNVRNRVARVRRYAQIVGIAARHGLRARRGEDPARLPARQVRLAFDEAGCMFVKLGQMLAGRPDVVGPALAGELTHLHEEVRPAPAEDVDALLREELGRSPDEVFARFDREPIAAASIAQVHRATLREDGARVVVKVQRPGIRELVERDLSIMMRLAARAEQRTAWGRDANVAAIAREFGENVLRELDFGREASNIAEVAAALRSTPEVCVPAVHGDLSTPRVLVMEELHGVTLAQGERAASLDVDREKLADVLLRASLASVVHGERFHADPHPGNVMILDDRRLGLLDLGSTGRLDALEQVSIGSMLLAIRRNDPELLREAVLEIATPRRLVDDLQLERALAQFMARHLGRGAVPSLGMLQDLARVFFDLGIAVPSSTTLLFRMLVTLEGTLTTLCPGYPVIQAAQDCAPELMQERLEEMPFADRIRDETTAILPVLRRAPRHLDRMATMLERGQLRVGVSPFATERDVRILARLVNRLVVAFVGAAVGVLSLLMLDLAGGPVLSGSVTLFDVFGWIGLGLSTVLLLRVVSAALREDVQAGAR
jgi:ubiquinone biosynthesis protein